MALSTPVAAAERPPVEAAPWPEAAGGGPAVGIKVHGRWTITVRNADGSIASRTEFNNALVPSGGQFLAQLLTTRAATGVTKWRVALVGSARASTADNLASVRTDLERHDDRGRISGVTPFTSASMQPGQPTRVQAGQTIDVRVVLSFSSTVRLGRMGAVPSEEE